MNTSHIEHAVMELNDKNDAAKEARHKARLASNDAANARQDLVQTIFDAGRTDLLSLNMPKLRRMAAHEKKTSKPLRSVGMGR